MKTLLLFISLPLFILLISCQSNQSEKDIYSVASDTTSAIGLGSDSVKLIKTASMQIKVKDALQGSKAVSQLAQRLGGFINHQKLESTEGQVRELRVSDDSVLVISSYTPCAEISARVPSQHLEEFMSGAIELGYFISSSNLDINDKSLDYLSADLKKQRRMKFLSSAATGNISDSDGLQLIALNDQIIDQDMSNRQINADVRYSTVSIRLFQNALVKKGDDCQL